MLTLRTHDITIFGGMNGKLLQKNYFLKNAKKTCKPNNCDLNRDWRIKNGTEVTLKLLSNVVGDSNVENNFCLNYY